MRNSIIIYILLPIGLNDIRIFDWWNYHCKNKNRIKIFTSRYTATINLQEKYSDAIIKYRKVRREIKKVSKSKNFYIDKEVKLNEILNLYNETFQRQKTSPQVEYIKILKYS